MSGRGAIEPSTNTSPDIVDDACAFAWMQFMRLQADRNRSWRSWLVTVAEREVWRLHGAVVALFGSGTILQSHMRVDGDA